MNSNCEELEEVTVGSGLSKRSPKECLNHSLNPNGNASGSLPSYTKEQLVKRAEDSAEEFLSFLGRVSLIA